jgi:hypothetical protein
MNNVRPDSDPMSLLSQTTPQQPSTLTTSLRSSSTPTLQPPQVFTQGQYQPVQPIQNENTQNIFINISSDAGSTGKGILIGVLSAFGTAGLVVLVLAIFFFFKYTSRGRILLDWLGRPGEYDDEQAFLREEAEAMESMDELQRAEYIRAKGTELEYRNIPLRLRVLLLTAPVTAFVQANPPETMQTDISLSQFLAIQEKGVSAWEFEPELEIANCFVEARTEIEFFDSECSVQSNLPVPKQNEVYYWEAKIYDKPDSSLLSIGMTTKPYPLFRLPGWFPYYTLQYYILTSSIGWHKSSVAYVSSGHRRYNQPFNPTNYGPPYVQGDVIGVGYRPRTGTIFFTRNGKKLDDVAHGLKSQNFFPTVGANGPCTVHVNFGQMGFVFIEANVKKWGLAPMTGSLAPPPPYGSEQGSILLEAGREGAQTSGRNEHGHGRTGSRIRIGLPNSPGPVRSPTDISLAHLAHIPSHEDAGEGTSGLGMGVQDIHVPHDQQESEPSPPPPEYSSPDGSRRSSEDDGEEVPLMRTAPAPPIPSYDAAVGNVDGRRRTDENDTQG